jgi:hypothetical protein
MDNAKTTDEVNRLYSDHLASLRLSGIEFNEAEILVAWDAALAEVE